MKKFFKIFILYFIISILIPQIVFATSIFDSIDVNKLDLNSVNNIKTDELKEKIENLSQNTNINSTNINSINLDTIIEAYNELSNVISNEEIANFIEDNKEVLSKSGVSQSTLSATSTLLKTFDAETVIDIIQNDLNLGEVIENSNSSEEIIEAVIENTSVTEKIQIGFKLLFSNSFFKLVFFLFVVIFIYSVIITAFLFKKAGKPWFATFIPIYRYGIYLRLYNFSPWLLLLLLVPIIGWLALIAISIVGKFELSKRFGHGAGFGIGLLLLPIVFKTYIVLSNDKFIDE